MILAIFIDSKYGTAQYNFVVTHMFTHSAMKNLQCIPVECLHGPRFIMANNLRFSCNLSSAMHEIVRHGVATCVIAIQGSRHARNMLR